ncbi:MAG: helix-turn-helix domain-containing protein [Thermoleophilia bacterium]
MAQDPWSAQVEALGRFIRSQRQLAKLSLRELAALSDLSNAYLSQLERGLHTPSMSAVSQIAKGLGMPLESLLQQAGVIDEERPAAASAEPVSTEAAIRADPNLTDAQREALLAVYRSFSEE